MSKCRRCGICCIVATDAQLTKEEAKDGRFEMIRAHKKSGRRRGWSKMILARKRIWSYELGKLVWCCFYFNEHLKLCTIYEERPTVCRSFNCEDQEFPKTDLHSVWKKLLDGSDEFYCLEG